MIRFLNFLALAAVIGTATWAYSVKYETILVAEKLKKRQTELRHERDAISVLEAEWQLLNRPARLATLAKPGEGMGQMSAKQVAYAKDIPAAAPVKADALDTLLTGSIPALASTPKAASGAAATTPKASTVKASNAKPASAKAAAKTAVKATDPTKKDAKSASKTAPKAVAAHGTPMPLAPKAGATQPVPKNTATPAPKVGAPTKITPPAPVGASAAARPNNDGLGALFKKILN